MITAKEDFDLRIYKLPTFGLKKCIHNGGLVTVNFDKIEVSYNGDVSVWDETYKKYVKYIQLTARAGEETYLESIFKILKGISVDRITDKKNQEKQKNSKVAAW